MLNVRPLTIYLTLTPITYVKSALVLFICETIWAPLIFCKKKKKIRKKIKSIKKFIINF